jgi:hypothetical protein
MIGICFIDLRINIESTIRTSNTTSIVTITQKTLSEAQATLV